MKIDHIAIAVNDVEESAKVYQQALGVDSVEFETVESEGVKVAIIDSLYCGSPTKTPSEKVARALVEEVLLTVENQKSSIFVSTFSSHIARIKSIVDYSKKLNRKAGRTDDCYISFFGGN